MKILRGELLVTNARIIYKVSTNKRYERNDGLFTSPKQRCIDEGFDIPIPLFYSIKQERFSHCILKLAEYNTLIGKRLRCFFIIKLMQII